MEGFPTSSSVWQRTAAWREEAPHLHVQSGLGLPEVTRFHLLLASLEPDWLLEPLADRIRPRLAKAMPTSWEETVTSSAFLNPPPMPPPPGRKRILIIKCSNYHIGYVLVILTNKVSIQSGGHETPSSPYLLTYMSGWNRTILPPLQNPYQAQWEAQAYHRPVVSGKPITASRQSPGFLRTCPCHVASAVNAAGFQAVTTA